MSASYPNGEYRQSSLLILRPHSPNWGTLDQEQAALIARQKEKTLAINEKLTENRKT
jgi:hypothetical protein